MPKKYVYQVEDRQLNNQGFYEYSPSSVEMLTSQKLALQFARERINCNTQNSSNGEMVCDSVEEPEEFFIYEPSGIIRMMDYFWMNGDKKVSQRVIITKRELRNW